MGNRDISYGQDSNTTLITLFFIFSQWPNTCHNKRSHPYVGAFCHCKFWHAEFGAVPGACRDSFPFLIHATDLEIHAIPGMRY